MEARKVAAQFAAYTWFEKTHKAKPAAQFVQENWQRFLPIAHEGLGRLLIKIGAGEKRKSTTRRRRPRASLAEVG